MRRFLLAAALCSAASAASAQALVPSAFDATVAGAVASPIPPGTNVGGKFGIDQTTPGVTNAVQELDTPSQFSGTCSSACSGTLIGPITTTGYASLQFAVSSVGVGGLAIQTATPASGTCASVQAGEWGTVPFDWIAKPNSWSFGAFTNANLAGTLKVDADGLCYRLVFTSYTSGTFTAVANLRRFSANIVTVHGPVPITPTPGQGTQNIASSTGTTGGIAPALAAQSSRTNYVCRIEVTSSGTTTAGLFGVTLAGLVGGTLTYEYWAPTTGQGSLVRDFNPCLQGSAVNTAATLTVPALGTGTTGVSAIISGYFE